MCALNTANYEMNRIITQSERIIQPTPPDRVITRQTQTSSDAVPYEAGAAGASTLIRNRMRFHPRTIQLIESSPSFAIIANKH